MKKILFTLALSLLMAFSATAQQEVNIKSTQLPARARQTVQTYYPKTSIVAASKMVFNGRTSYKAAIDEGSFMFFDASGNWNMARSYDGLPDKIVPAKIRKYVSDYHEGQLIVEIQKLRRTYRITLTDGTSLEFYLNGNFYGFR